MKIDAATQALLAPFSNPDAVSHYAEGPPRFVPGFADLHLMTDVLLSERAPRDARVLVHGAGGGLELKALAERHDNWTFVGVDPAKEMLAEAERTLGSLAERVKLHHGYIDDAPEGPFDAATSLLTLHFLDAEERLRTAGEIRKRMKSGAPIVIAHSSFPQGTSERSTWLSRYAAFAVASGVDPEIARKIQETVAAGQIMFDPVQDEAILRDAGFRNVQLFYTAFTWRGWIAYAH